MCLITSVRRCVILKLRLITPSCRCVSIIVNDAIWPILGFPGSYLYALVCVRQISSKQGTEILTDANFESKLLMA